MIVFCEKCMVDFIGESYHPDKCPFCEFRKNVIKALNLTLSLETARKFEKIFNEQNGKFKLILTGDGINEMDPR